MNILDQLDRTQLKLHLCGTTSNKLKAACQLEAFGSALKRNHLGRTDCSWTCG